MVLPRLYQLGTAAGLIIAAVLVAGFAWSIAEAARRHADALSVTQLALAREQQLSALGGQAAAAAHLLGTPLGTITIIAKELVRELPEGSPLAEDARELHAQAQRCRELLRSLGRPADNREHDPFTSAPMTACLEEIAQRHGRPGIRITVRLQPVDDTPEPVPHVTPEFRHAIANLIENASRFARREVWITVRPSRSGLTVLIEDDGPGFSAEVLDWVGEPFLSTGREQGGLGLGIFIAITLLARGGARLQFDNTGTGARVAIIWPPDAMGSGAEGVGQ
jgi:two-component system sensor histidine kinase RegB